MTELISTLSLLEERGGNGSFNPPTTAVGSPGNHHPCLGNHLINMKETLLLLSLQEVLV